MGYGKICKEYATEEEITELLKYKLVKRNILFQEQAIKLMSYKANGSSQKASEILKKVCEFAKYHNDNVLSTHTTYEAIKQFDE